MRFTEFFTEENDLEKKRTVPPLDIKSRDVVSKDDTEDAIANVDTSQIQGMDDRMAQLAQNKDLIYQYTDDEMTDLIPVDDEEEEEGVGVTIEEPNTLPQEIRQDLRTHGDVTARFHSVENLPGYLDDAIRMMGQKVFASLTATPIDEINVLVNLGDQGPNEQRELNAVAGMVDTYGERRGDYEMKFDRILPGYEADIRVYEYKNQIFCLVKDFAGSYIYSWPAENKKLN
jgi:hypothetical protein